MPIKHALKSKGIWGGLIGALSSIILFFVSKTAQDKYFALTTFFSSVLAIYGRWTAKHKLYFRRQPHADSKADTVDTNNIDRYNRTNNKDQETEER